MPVHPVAQMILDASADAGGPPMEEQTVDQAREGLRALAAMATVLEVGSVQDTVFAGPAGDVALRIYRPTTALGKGALVWFHGGGWVIGDLDTADAGARALCEKAGVVVISVDYRLAPEQPFPAALDDCQAAFHWVRDNADTLDIDADRIAVGGDSAGGNLAAVVANLERETVAHQLLVYPVTDCTFSHPSHQSNGDGYLLTHAGMVWFVQHYLGDGDRTDPLVSPLMTDDLTGVPTAQVITAEFDPLRDEGDAYAQRLREAGVAVDHTSYDGMVHAFWQLNGVIDVADTAHDAAAARLRSALQ